MTSAPILLAAGAQTQAPGVNLIAPNTKFQDRWNQFDLSAKRTFRFGKKEFQGQFAVFNVMNGNVVLQEVQTYGATLGQPQNFLAGAHDAPGAARQLLGADDRAGRSVRTINRLHEKWPESSSLSGHFFV